MNETILILIAVVAGFAGLAFLQFRKKDEPKKDDETLKVMMEWMKDIKQGTEITRVGMQKSIDETNKAINERLDNAGRVIAALTKELGSIGQVGPDIRRLTETLASPKLRGNFGEEMLHNLLSQVLPPSAFEIQHKFKTGETVDAVVFVGEKKLCIDSKFSMENYRLYQQAKEPEVAENLKKAFFKDIKNRITEIYKKYILPQEGTFDFAMMYIPSEGVYLEVAGDQEVMDNARSKKIIFVGPNTLYLTLQTFLISLRGQKINEAANNILNMIAGIKQESERFTESLRLVGGHMQKATSAYDKSLQDYNRLKTNIDNASSLELKVEKEVTEELPDKLT